MTDENCYVCCCSGEGILELACGHRIHSECLENQLASLPKKGSKFNPQPARCGVCRDWISHANVAERVNFVRETFERLLTQLLDIELTDHEKELITANEASKIDAFRKYVFFHCYSCNGLYYGGLVECTGGEDRDDTPNEERMCGICASSGGDIGDQWCPKHGVEFTVYKCRECCRLAVWACGPERYCNHHHGDEVDPHGDECPGAPRCCGIHQDGEFALGCVLCRTSKKDEGDAVETADAPRLPSAVDSVHAALETVRVSVETLRVSGDRFMMAQATETVSAQ